MIDRVVASLEAGIDIFLNNAMKIFSEEKEKKEKRARYYKKMKKEREFNRLFNSLNVAN